jgi:hypothetical protein
VRRLLLRDRDLHVLERGCAHATALPCAVQRASRLGRLRRLQDDKVVYIYDYEDRADALEAAGLSGYRISVLIPLAFARALDPLHGNHSRAAEGAIDDAGPMRGVDAMRAYMQDWLDDFEELSIEPEELIDAGEQSIRVSQDSATASSPPRPHASNKARTASTFSCDIARSVSPGVGCRR